MLSDSKSESLPGVGGCGAWGKTGRSSRGFLTHLVYSQMLAPPSTCTSSGTILLQASLSNLEAMEQIMQTNSPISLEAPSPKVLTPNLPTVYKDPHLHWLTTGNHSVSSVACIPRCGMGGWHPTPHPRALSKIPHPLLPPGVSTGEEKEFSLRIMKYWANFAHTG